MVCTCATLDVANAAHAALLQQVNIMVKTERLEELREMDQLTVEMANGRVFNDFFEGRLSFPPTYKLIPGTRYSACVHCMHACMKNYQCSIAINSISTALP
jgi:hypothetical protein